MRWLLNNYDFGVVFMLPRLNVEPFFLCYLIWRLLIFSILHGIGSLAIEAYYKINIQIISLSTAKVFSLNINFYLTVTVRANVLLDVSNSLTKCHNRNFLRKKACYF